MTKKSEKNMIVGLDIGTSKVVAIVGEISPQDEIEIIVTVEVDQSHVLVVTKTTVNGTGGKGKDAVSVVQKYNIGFDLLREHQI